LNEKFPYNHQVQHLTTGKEKFTQILKEKMWLIREKIDNSEFMSELCDVDENELKKYFVGNAMSDNFREILSIIAGGKENFVGYSMCKGTPSNLSYFRIKLSDKFAKVKKIPMVAFNFSH